MANNKNIDTTTKGDSSSDDDYLMFCDKTDFFFKKIETLRDIIQTRNNDFSQRKEIYENLVNLKINNIERKKENYLKKSEELATKIEERNAQLISLNHNFSQLKEKYNKEKEINEVLTARINKLQLDAKQKEQEFIDTLKNYKEVIMWYEDFLGFDLNFEEDKNQIISIYFKTSEVFNKYSHVSIKILDNDKFEVIKMHSSVEEKFNCVISRPELMLLLYKVQESLINLSPLH